MMPRIWNGKDLEKEVPELGLRLDFASLIPEFADQLLMSGLCADTEHLLLTPLDDLKAWLRTQNPGEDGLKHEVRELLLAQEEKDRTKAAAAGIRFDLVEYELTQMQADETYEQFNVEWARNILALVVEEADALQGWARAELDSNFSISLSFSLPDPRKNALLKPGDIESSLRKFGADDRMIARTLKGQGKRPEYTGMLLLELADRGKARPPRPAGGTYFVSVGLADPRAGDHSDAALSLAYPKELEGYFLLTFDALRQQLTLKEEP
jgi:hypothetical protein